MPKGYRTTQPFCIVPDCGKQTIARGYCKKHYYAWREHGDPLVMARAPNGAGHTDKAGYRHVFVNGKHTKEHRVVMAEHLGRPLESFEVVHHIDGDPSNNALENLIVLTQARHMAMHAKGYRDDVRKQCTRCWLIKPRTDFGIHYKKRATDAGDSHHSWCKACQREHALKKWREKNPDRPRRATRNKLRTE